MPHCILVSVPAKLKCFFLMAAGYGFLQPAQAEIFARQQELLRKQNLARYCGSSGVWGGWCFRATTTCTPIRMLQFTI